MNKGVNISVQVIVTKRSKLWIAYCPALKTYGSSAKSKEGALKDFDEAIQTFFHVQEALGTLNKTLLNFGWQRNITSKSIKAPKLNSTVAPYRNNNSTTRQINVPALC